MPKHKTIYVCPDRYFSAGRIVYISALRVLMAFSASNRGRIFITWVCDEHAVIMAGADKCGKIPRATVACFQSNVFDFNG